MSAIERIRKALNRPRTASTPLGPVVVIDPIVRREDLAELLAEMDRLRAENRALLNALETMLIGACAVGVPHAGERQVLQECVDAARAVIAAARKAQA